MGIEYSVTSESFEREGMDRLLEKVFSTVENYVTQRSSEQYEIKFTSSNTMPDASINIEPNGIVFVYNSGYEASWALFGLLVGYMSEHFGSLTVSEL
jgi:hypothetical protein